MVASKATAPDNPGWYHNLKTNPVARVDVGTESGTETLEVRAREAEGEERERIRADRIAIAPGFLDQKRKTSRRIPRHGPGANRHRGFRGLTPPGPHIQLPAGKSAGGSVY